MTETQARDEICRIGRSLYERGYVHATAGNISGSTNRQAAASSSRPPMPAWVF